ncbi:MAG: hypothetical protein EA396_07545 [Anaerolineaceae bacterium]|nr:MAG: hypothetical protein EA396_07545 [Anaerolineaceae bacterium]
MNRLLAVLILACLLAGVVRADDADDSPVPITPQNAAQLTIQHTLEAHEMPVSALTFGVLADGRAVLATTGDNLSLRLWDARTGEALVEAYPHSSVMKGVAFAPTGDVIVTASWDRTVRRHRISADDRGGYTLEQLPAFVGFTHIIDRVRYSDDGAWLGFAVGDGSVHILDNADFDRRHIYAFTALSILDIAFVPDADGAFLTATGFPDDGLWLGNGITGDDPQMLPQAHAGGINALALTTASDDGWTLATAGDDGTVHLWALALGDDGATMDALAIITAGTGNEWLSGVAFNAAGDLLAVASREGGAYLYDVSDTTAPQLLREINGANGAGLVAIAFDDSGAWLATGDDSGVVTVWGVPALNE